MRLNGCFRLTLAIAAALWLTGCASSPSEGSGAPRASSTAPAELRVGVSEVSAPLAYKEAGEWRGLEPDFARRLAAHLGRQLRFVAVPWNQQIESLLAGRTDIIMSGMSLTAERQARVSFCSPYLRSGQAALVRRDQVEQMRFLLLTEPFKIGVQPGTTGDYFAQQRMTLSKRRPYGTPADGARAVIDKKIDAFIHDAPIVWWLASQHESDGLTFVDTYLTEENLAWAVRRDDAKLLAEANAFLDLKRQSGELRGIIAQWISYAR